MVELKIFIPEELKKKMEKLQIDWSPFIRETLRREVEELNEVKSIISKSMLTEEEALILGRRISENLGFRFKELAKK
jgi:hypothetical protein